jgi:hypothetical protein
MPLVTSARFVKWSGRRRGDRDDGQPVKRSKPRVGHGEKGSLRGPLALNTRSENASRQTKVLTPDPPFIS